MEVKEPSARYLRAKHQTEVGELPADWSCASLGDVADILTGFPFPSAGYSGAGVRLLRGSNVKRDQIEWREDLTMYWPDVTADIRKYVLKVGDVVIAMDGSLVGRSFGALSERDVPALLLQRVARVRSSEVDVGYLKHWICSERFTAHSDAVKTTTAIPHISPGDIRSFKVAVPPTILEQQQIGDALSDTDALIDSLEQLLTKKRQIKQGAMQELLTGRRRLPGFTDKWVNRTLLQLADIRSGGTPSTRQPEFWEGDIPWCTPTDITALTGVKHISATERSISEKGQKASSAEMLPAGTIVMTSRATIGECAIAAVPLTTNQGFKNFVPRSTTCGEFLYYLLGTQKPALLALCSGSTFLEIGKRQLEDFIVRCPVDFNEQEAVARALSDMDAEISAIESRLTKARALKQAMAQALLTGRIRLVEPTP